MPVPTPRLLFVTLAGSPLVVLAGTHAAALVVALCWLGGAGVAAFIDTRFVPAREELNWRREHDQKLSLGAWNPIELRVMNGGRRSVHLRIRDQIPQILTPRREMGRGHCAAGCEWSLRYAVFPIHRGDVTLGPLAVRYLGPLGLAWRQHTLPLVDDVKVYPNFLAIRSYEALLRVGRPNEVGLVNARRWGEGTEFERLREYTPDDDFRRIDWKATARRRQPIVADFQPERSQNVLLALDTGRLMSLRVPLEAADDTRVENWPHEISAAGRALTRLDYAVNASLLLAFACHRHGDRVGLLAFSDRVQRFAAPRSGRRQFAAIGDALYNLEADPTEPDFGVAFNYLAVRGSRRSLIILFTDFSDPEGAQQLVSRAAHLARRHLLLVATVLDPAVRDLARARVIDSSSVYRRAVASTLMESRESIRLQLRQAGVLTIDGTADALTPSVINRYLEIKARGLL